MISTVGTADMAWTWRLESTTGGEPPDPPDVPGHGSQADAESWLGEHWRALRDAGVGQVWLLDGASVVYGPMSLAEE